MANGMGFGADDAQDGSYGGDYSGGDSGDFGSILAAIKAYAPQLQGAWGNMLGNKAQLGQQGPVDLNLQRYQALQRGITPGIPVGFSNQLAQQALNRDFQNLGRNTKTSWESDK